MAGEVNKRILPSIRQVHGSAVQMDENGNIIEEDTKGHGKEQSLTTLLDLPRQVHRQVLRCPVIVSIMH